MGLTDEKTNVCIDACMNKQNSEGRSNVEINQSNPHRITKSSYFDSTAVFLERNSVSYYYSVAYLTYRIDAIAHQRRYLRVIEWHK